MAGPVHVSVAGNRLINGKGHPMRLLGVNRSGTEYACVQGWGIFDGPSNAASVAAIASWHANAVRVPLNEDCWLGINGVNPHYAGPPYRHAIAAYVHLLNTHGMAAILDLHWSAPGSELATGQQIMADASHSPAFWRSIASYFKYDPGVVFDLYNEPHGISWSCWLRGCISSGGWATAGMQTMVNAVRSTGAAQPIMASGLNWGGDLSGWLAHQPMDPLHQLAADVHIYNFSQCNTTACWNRTIAPVATKVPVVTGELGENNCRQNFIDTYMKWADHHRVSYLGWAWDAGGGWTCTNGPSLITSYSGTPTPYGAGLRQHLRAVAAAGTPQKTKHPAAALSTTAIRFGPLTLGSVSPAVQVRVTDTGGAPLAVAKVRLTGKDPKDFSLPQDRCRHVSLRPGTHCTLAVSFAPRTSGARSAGVTITDNAPGAPQVIVLAGKGNRPMQPGAPAIGYQPVHTWSHGLQAKLVITNRSPFPWGTSAQPWVLRFTLPSSATVTSLWNGVVSRAKKGGVTTYTVAAPPWHRSVAPGSTWNVGYVVSGSTSEPGGCHLDGDVCSFTEIG